MADRSTSRTARYRSAEKAPIGGGIRGAAVKWISAHHRCRQPSERSREVVKGKPDRERLAAGGHHLQIRAWPLARFSTVLRSSLQRITQPFRIQIIERRPDGGVAESIRICAPASRSSPFGSVNTAKTRPAASATQLDLCQFVVWSVFSSHHNSICSSVQLQTVRSLARLIVLCD